MSIAGKSSTGTLDTFCARLIRVLNSAVSVVPSKACEVVKPDYSAAAVPPDSALASESSTPTLGDLWRVGPLA